MRARGRTLRGRSRGSLGRPDPTARPLLKTTDHGDPLEVRAHAIGASGERWVEPFLQANAPSMRRLRLQVDVCADSEVYVRLTPAGGGGDPGGAPVPLAGPGRRLQLDRPHRGARPGLFPAGPRLRTGRAALNTCGSRHPASRGAVAAQPAELRGAPGNALQSPRPRAVADVDLHATAARRVDPIPVPLLGTRERPGSPGQREVDPLSPDGGVVASCLVPAGPLPPASSG